MKENTYIGIVPRQAAIKEISTPNKSRSGNIRIVTRPASIADIPEGQFFMQPAYINVKI